MSLIVLQLGKQASLMGYPRGEKDCTSSCVSGAPAQAAISPTYPVAERRRINKVISGGQFIRTGTFTVPMPRLV